MASRRRKRPPGRASRPEAPAARETTGGSPSPRGFPRGWQIGLGGTAAVLLGLLLIPLLQSPGAESPRPQVPQATASAAEAPRSGFDGARAFRELEKQVAFGPRVPGLESHAACRDYLVDTLKQYADSVERQNFSRRVNGKTLPMSNIVARFRGKNGSSPGVLLAAHWDTRPIADYERTPERRRMPIAGANDGASGVAVLLEAARLFKARQPDVPVMIVLFDGEDFGPGLEHMFFGSRYFAEHLPPDTPRRGILLDMVGDRDLVIPQELYSLQNARDVLDEVYAIAARLGLERSFPRRPGSFIEDDHVPLQRKGIRMINLIDFDYGPGHSWWHTLEDTPDKCSPQSLKAVGDVVVEWVYSRKPSRP